MVEIDPNSIKNRLRNHTPPSTTPKEEPEKLEESKRRRSTRTKKTSVSSVEEKTTKRTPRKTKKVSEEDKKSPKSTPKSATISKTAESPIVIDSPNDKSEENVGNDSIIIPPEPVIIKKNISSEIEENESENNNENEIEVITTPKRKRGRPKSINSTPTKSFRTPAPQFDTKRIKVGTPTHTSVTTPVIKKSGNSEILILDNNFHETPSKSSAMIAHKAITALANAKDNDDDVVEIDSFSSPSTTKENPIEEKKVEKSIKKNSKNTSVKEIDSDIEEVTIKKTPSKETSAKKTPTKETPSKETPSKETPSKKTPVKEIQAKENQNEDNMEIDTSGKIEEKKSSHITFDDDDFDVKAIKVTQVNDSNNVEITQKKTVEEEDDDEEIVYSSEEEENVEEEPETVSLKTGREDALKLLKSAREREIKMAQNRKQKRRAKDEFLKAQASKNKLEMLPTDLLEEVAEDNEETSENEEVEEQKIVPKGKHLLLDDDDLKPRKKKKDEIIKDGFRVVSLKTKKGLASRQPIPQSILDFKKKHFYEGKIKRISTSVDFGRNVKKPANIFVVGKKHQK
ncbi:hypothetical protein BCR36DRAFT_413672 [Piromyces finnis]|uniref:Uncharacterized protein n=1 Tax=Piromyces finnis TaxID=1754191 RepID=A0A1Y1V4T8_9FUNG|nr:hypothetical protein BCR36DRAFT_413672 [Piromyces finnis]|eukprot:ORX47320.1 hypothetical protein BCR36DRAFT_413672 [Piromyces finnis]